MLGINLKFTPQPTGAVKPPQSRNQTPSFHFLLKSKAKTINQPTMDLSTVRTILRLNNAAAAYFHCANFEEAMQLFRVALTTSRKLLLATQNSSRNDSTITINRRRQSQPSAQNQNGSVMSDAALGQCVLLLLRSPEATAAAQHSPQTTPSFLQRMGGDDEELEFVYLAPVTMEEQEFLNTSTSCKTLEVMCTFNLAITLHAKDIFEVNHHFHPHQGSTAHVTIKKPTSPASTVRLYEHSYSLLSEQEQHDGDYLCDKVWLISFAILNNLGVLHKQLRSQDKSQSTFEMLLSMLMYRREQYSFVNEEASYICAMEAIYSNALAELGVLSYNITAASA
jgi:hypothetical protein